MTVQEAGGAPPLEEPRVLARVLMGVPGKGERLPVMEDTLLPRDERERLLTKFTKLDKAAFERVLLLEALGLGEGVRDELLDHTFSLLENFPPLGEEDEQRLRSFL